MSPISTRSHMLLILTAILVALLAGCSSQNSQSVFDPQTGKHPANWMQTHPTNFLAKPSQCYECHGTDLHGGISKVSCFSASFGGIGCHASGPGHPNPATWALPAQHGTAAKAAPNAAAMQGFSTCQICHGSTFAGGFGQTCLNTAGCHGVGVMSPHPVSWSSGTASTYHHNTTDPANASACALCHTNGANSPLGPLPPLPGTPPGCFNSTLCHGPIGHAAGFAAPAQHGTAAKAAPNAATTSGFSTCQTCHGNDFTGGVSLQTCLNTAGCHGVGVNAPHAFPWTSTSTFKHSTTDTANAPVCGLCHLANRQPPSYAALPPGSTPGCFDSTLCHAAAGHPAGWNLPAAHGASAKAAPNAPAMQGFSTCQTCHGSNFAGGTGQTCLNTTGCHGVGVNAPHAFPWKSTSTYQHSTTDTANAPVCGLCHLGNPATPAYAPLPPGANPGCFNNTLCHSTTGGTCISCHASTQNGRRVITGAGGDFVRPDHHVTNGTTNEIVTNTDCVACHGDLIADLSHPAGAPISPAVQLMDPDAGSYVATTPAGIELVCSKCHDSNGATRLGGSALTPFSAAGDNTHPPNINWTATQQAHSYNAGIGGGGCMACHGNAGVRNAHGSSQPKMMKFTYNSADTVKATTNVCYNCHGQTPANGTTKAVGIDFLPATQVNGHKTILCLDCHNPHTAKTGNHTNGTTLAGVLNGSTGIGVTTWSATNWGGVTTYAAVATATAEWQVCFKCHSGTGSAVDTANPPTGPATNKTDMGLEFNPNNASYHPVIQALTAGTANHRQLAAGALTGGWTPGSVMTCSDCHGTDTAGAKGPHGSAVKWMLNPNTTGTKYFNWPYTSAANNGTSSGTLLTGTGSSSTQPNGGQLFCLSCHVWSGGGAAHTRGDHSGVACVSCHIRVPHGGKVYRLLATKPASGNGNLPPRYWPNGNGGGTIDIVSVRGNLTSGTLGQSDVQTSCGQHGSAPTSATTW